MGSPSVNYLYKVNPDTGIAVWSCNIGGAPCYPGAPAIGLDGAIYVYTGSILDNTTLRRVNPNGTLGWSVNLSPFAYSYTWQLGTAVLKNGDIVCSGGSTGKIFCFHPNGTPVWEYQYTSWTLETPCVGPEGNIYFTTWDGGLAQTGRFIQLELRHYVLSLGEPGG
jgi:outer membrane protein assembly factor BamB